jgi:hypothetical protein
MMDDDELHIPSYLPLGPAAPGSQSETGEDGETWDIVHVGAADTPDHGAQAMMRTSDGDFRISAAEVDGKVGLKIERLHPPETPAGSDESGESGEADKSDASDVDEQGQTASTIPHPRRTPESD